MANTSFGSRGVRCWFCQEGRGGFSAWGTSGSAEQLFGVFFLPWQGVWGLQSRGTSGVHSPRNRNQINRSWLQNLTGFWDKWDFGISGHFICHFNKIQNSLWFECAVKSFGSWTVSPLSLSHLWGGEELDVITSLGAEAVLGLVLALSRLCDKLINQGGVGNSLLENTFIPADRLQWVYIFGSPVCTFPWQRPLGPVPPGHVSGDKPTQEQMAPMLRLRWGCALPCLPANPTATNPTFLPAYPWSTFLNSLSTLGVFPDGCLYFFFPFSIFAGLMAAAMS